MSARFFAWPFLVLVVCACPVFADVFGEGTFETSSITDANNEVFSTISIMESEIIEDISVTIQGLQHTNTGDLIAELRFLGNGNDRGGSPAYIFFRPNVDVGDTLGSRADLNGNYTFTTDEENDASFWKESALPDDETVSDKQDYFFSGEGGDFLDLSSIEFFGGQSTQGDWQLIIRDENAFGNNEGSVQGWTLNFQTIPEPSTSVLMLGVASWLMIRRRRLFNK